MVESALVIALASVSSAFIIAWFVNSYWARRFEKRRKKYEAKLETYRSVAEVVNTVHLANLYAKEFRKASSLTSSKGDSSPSQESREAEASTKALCYLRILKRSLSIDTSKDYSEVPMDRAMKGNHIFTYEDLVHHAPDFMECLDTITEELAGASAQIRIVGNTSLSEKIGRMIGIIMRSVKVNLGQDIGPEDLQNLRDLNDLIEDVLTVLAEDLEKTL